ncbi:IS3 family transposase [Escherichia coli]|uniref:IS3 family transposase n=1 Tax=Escherichia coli TaxID=562 RepID=UPI001C70A939|nr:IS3 family transposase [Escherichia coli]MBW9630859.1 IS3 family transposase [Escherichia coli]
MTKNTRFSPEVRQRAVRMVLESQGEYDSQWATICSIAPKIGCTPETLRVWVRQHERDTGGGDGGLTTAERQRLKELERENRELRRSNRGSRAQLHVILRRADDWKDGRRSRHTDDTDVLRRIHHVIGELPTYGYRRVWALLRRQTELDGMPAINAKRIYRIMRQNALLLERKTAVPPSKRAHTGRVAVKESNQRWCSDGFEFRCDNGEKLRVTFALDCCDREALHWAVTTDGFNSETVQDVMPGAVERRFGNELPASPVEWLTDNGSCYRANETRQFARMLGLEPKNTAVRSPESNGIAESFVKTIKRDYISIMPKPDGLTAAKNLAEAFEHYNEWHPHSALGYRSPREYLRQRACNGLSDNRCLEI